MFPGVFPISDEPLSTYGVVTENGEIFGFGFTIDKSLPLSSVIDSSSEINLIIEQSEEFGVIINRQTTKIVEVERQQEFTLIIDEHNTWDLS